MKKSILNKKTKKHTTKRLLKNKLGMTYVELLTALALLALIITSFTPMLLSSYQTLYEAGEKVQDVYDSKEEMEEGLARRDSEKSVAIKLDMRVNRNLELGVNGDLLFQGINATGRKIISTFQEGLETVFGQIRPRVEIISPSTVFDDSTSHDVTLQTFGLEYKKITFGTFTYDTTNEPDAANKMPADQIHIQVIIPNKKLAKESGTADEKMKTTNDGLVYNVTTGPFCDVSFCENVIVDDDVVVNATTVPAGGLDVSNSDNAGRIKLRISHPSLDFTYSPLKVNVFYINSRGQLRTVSDYLYIDPATLLLAGETKIINLSEDKKQYIDYYTSAGIQAINVSPDDTTKKIKYQIQAEARKMRTDNSNYLSVAGQYNVPAIGAPSSKGTEIRSIRWIDNDETQGLNPYYVMTGTNGAIYRMYSFQSDKAELFNYAIGKNIGTTTRGFFNATKEYIDRVYTTLDGRRVFPSYWGGDFSHIFEYSSAKTRTAYGKSENHDYDECWVTSALSSSGESAGIKGSDEFNIMSAQAQFCYYYNGNATNFKYNFKNSRPISYVLTESGWPIRLWGIIGPIDKGIIGGILNSTDLYADYTAIWDISNINNVLRADTVYQDPNEILAFHYKHKDESWQIDNAYAPLRIKALASYPLTSAQRDEMRVDYFDSNTDSDGEYENTGSQSKLKNVQNTSTDFLNGAGQQVNITDVVYIPGTKTTEGSTFYVGNVHAYCNVIQTDKISHDYRHGENKSEGGLFSKYDPIADAGMKGKYYRNQGSDTGTNKSSYPLGAITEYLILSNPDGTATYIAKHNGENLNGGLIEWETYDGTDKDGYVEGTLDNSQAEGPGWQMAFCNDYIKTMDHLINEDSAINFGLDTSKDSLKNAEFFIPSYPEKDQKQTWKYLYLGDVNFTFGYASNRERVYTNITYDGTVEYNRSFERLYWRSEFAQDAIYYKENEDEGYDPIPANQDVYTGEALSERKQVRALSVNAAVNKDDPYLNEYNNDYYNVWFPGEMYNLNKIASKDGVTVAVGYAVAGSAYQYVHGTDTSATSTALGGVYNDGVLAAMVEGQDSAFVNLLYFKDNETFDDDSLSTKYPDRYGSYGTYGTHKRDSVQFTAVDLIVESSKDTNNISYYAYYGDNKGRVFKSLVATGTGSTSGVDANGDPIVTKSIETVPFIKSKTSVAEETTKKQKYTVGGLEVPYSAMEEIKVNGESLNYYFKNIGTIDATDDMIIVTGEKSDKVLHEYIVVGVKVEKVTTNTSTGEKESTWEWQWKAVRNGTFTDKITDATIVGGYYYIVGNYAGQEKGWLAGVSIDTLKDLATSTKINDSQRVIISAGNGGSSSYESTELLWCDTDIKLYAIAGRDTQ